MSSGQKSSTQRSTTQKVGSGQVAAAAKTPAKRTTGAPKTARSQARKKSEGAPAEEINLPESESGNQNNQTGNENSPDNQETDEAGISLAASEWNEIEPEDPAEILEDPAIALELSEDPVRLYLKEIGQINLLDADAEFRLAARIEACVRVKALRLHVRPCPGNDKHYRALFTAIISELITSWTRLQEDAARMGLTDYPDLALTLAEARLLRQSWQADEPSYLHNYLDNGLWGKDPVWEALVRQAFTVFMCMYLLPERVSSALFDHITRSETLPEMTWLKRRLPDEQALESEIEEVCKRSEEGN